MDDCPGLNGCVAERCVHGVLTDGGLRPVLDGLEGDGAAHCRGPGLVEKAQAEDRACSTDTKIQNNGCERIRKAG